MDICPACDLLPFEALAREVTPAPISIKLDHLDVEALGEQAWQCDLCRALLNLREHWLSQGSVGQLKDDGVTFYRSMCGKSDWRLRNDDDRYLTMYTDFDSVLAERVDHHHIYREPLSGRTLEAVQHWIKKCEREHSKCFEHQSNIPTRVIDVRSTQLRLLDPSPEDSEKYVALSHCWGTCRDFLTTRENLAQRKSGFQLEDLPATFRDAVTATRALGIPFLWIDSVCILQGDRDDWEIEGSKMADVYSNATICIAATDAVDDAEGFLVPRKQLPFLTIDITFSSPATPDERLTTRIYTALPYNGYAERIRFPPLNDRAWCLQERCLSPRILFFNFGNLHWECLEDAWFETGRVYSRLKEMLPDIMPSQSPDGLLLHSPWYRMIGSYTKRSITFASDKLPAVSALASRVAERTGDVYIAGLWRSDLLRGLLWHRDNKVRFRPRNVPASRQETPRRSECYIAPTWSWASYLGGVDFRTSWSSLYLLPSVQLVDAVADVPGKNKFGETQSGHVSITSPLLTFEERSTLSERLKEPSYNDISSPLDSHDLGDFDTIIEAVFDYPQESRDGWLLGIPLAYENLADRSPDGSQSKPRAIGEPPWLKIYGILIVEQKGDSGFYERVGSFSIESVQLEDFLDVLRRVWFQETRIV